MMRGSLLLLIFGMLCTGGYAQQTGKIETDRPDQTESPYVVPVKWYQGEMGFNLEKNRSGLKSFLSPTLLSKYGVSKKFELRLITEIATEETPLLIPQGNDYITGLKPVRLGGKIALFEEKGFRPKTSLLFHTSIPKLASKKFQEEHWNPEFRLSMQHTLSEVVGIGYNLGAEWDDEDRDPSFIYTFAPGFNLGEKWYVYAEVFGYIKSGSEPDHRVDTGFSFNPSDNTKLDLSAGLGLGSSDLKYYTAIGFSFRLPLSSKH